MDKKKINKCPVCHQKLSEKHKKLIEKSEFFTKKYFDDVQESIKSKDSSRNKRSIELIKDLIMLILGFLIGKFVMGIGFYQMTIVLLGVGFLIYVFLGELLGVPLFKWYVTTIKITGEGRANKEWREFKEYFSSGLNVDIVDLKKSRFIVYCGKFDEEDSIVLASKYKKAIDFLTFEAFSNKKNVFIKENSYSLIQSFLRFRFLLNRGWYPKITSAFTEDLEFSRFDISLITYNKLLRETYETICNQIDSLEIFHKEKESVYYQKMNHISCEYGYKKGLSNSILYISTFGTDIHIQLYYSEKGGIEFDKEGRIAKNRKELLNKISKKLNEVLKNLKEQKIMYKQKLKEVSLLKGKYEQNEIFKISKYRDKKSFIYR